jgi:hypothetical protein
LVTSLRDSKKKTIQDDIIRHDSRSDTDESIVQIFSIKSFSLSRRNNGCRIEQARESFNREVCRARNVRGCFFEDITTKNEASAARYLISGSQAMTLQEMKGRQSQDLCPNLGVGGTDPIRPSDRRDVRNTGHAAPERLTWHPLHRCNSSQPISPN